MKDTIRGLNSFLYVSIPFFIISFLITFNICIIIFIVYGYRYLNFKNQFLFIKNQILFKFFIISCLIYGKYFEYFEN